MVKLSPELIEQCASYTNPVKDREIDFRGTNNNNSNSSYLVEPFSTEVIIIIIIIIILI